MDKPLSTTECPIGLVLNEAIAHPVLAFRVVFIAYDATYSKSLTLIGWCNAIHVLADPSLLEEALNNLPN